MAKKKSVENLKDDIWTIIYSLAFKFVIKMNNNDIDAKKNKFRNENQRIVCSEFLVSASYCQSNQAATKLIKTQDASDSFQLSTVYFEICVIIRRSHFFLKSFNPLCEWHSHRIKQV